MNISGLDLLQILYMGTQYRYFKGPRRLVRSAYKRRKAETRRLFFGELPGRGSLF